MPTGVRRHLRRVREDDVIDARVEIPQPPPLVRRLLGQQREQGPVVLLPFLAVGHRERDVGLEDSRDGSGDRPAGGRALGDPGDFGVCPNTPRAAVPGPPNHAVSLSALSQLGLAIRCRGW